jgi:hypothetical protein
MRLRQPIGTAVAVALAAVAVGCGSDSEGERLPPGISEMLVVELEEVRGRVANGSPGACDDIYETGGGNIDPLDDALADIPESVDPEIRAALEGSFDRLKELVDSECDEIRAEGLREELDPTEPEETETAPETETDTETEPPPETEPPDTTTDTTPEPPPTNPGGQTPEGNGPDGDGPPGQDEGGAEAPSDG